MDNRLIRRLEYAGLLSDAEREALHSLALRPRTVAARTDIDIGGPPNSVCLILSGIACRYKIWSDGARRIISLIVPGDLCDGHLPLPFLLGHTVGALTPCTVADIPRQAMAELIETYPRGSGARSGG
ncbi:Crp/Fnr family transcriptional regulator [Methylobacterium nigriterrae]|uniref:Crp/Fnr family transcriptional regulator n=1 Tax=Methylobacterium nigriterrae TaxID=3127512 RepID=UPI00301361AD